MKRKQVFQLDKDRIQLTKEIIFQTIGAKSVYTVEDVQKLFNKSRNQIYELIYDGILVPVEQVNGNKPRKYTFTLLSLIDAYLKLTKGA